MSLPVPDASYPTQSQLLSSMLSALRFFYGQLNPPVVRNVLPGSDDYVRLNLLAGRISIVIANNQVALQNSSPLTATGDDLRKLASLFGVFPRPAASGVGAVSFSLTGGATIVAIPSSFTCTAPTGKQYTATPGVYSTAASIPITAVDAGFDTNQLPNTILQWDLSTIANLNSLCTVTGAGVTGGVDADTDEPLRQRLLQSLAAAAGGGNWSQVAQAAENASASVQAAYCYPAAQGAGSYSVALTALASVSNQTRVVPAATVAQVGAIVESNLPGQQQGNFTSVTPQYVDVLIFYLLPFPQSAGGSGGGYLDAQPWPIGEDVKVTAFNAGTQTATVNATLAAPIVGNNIAIWDQHAVDPTTNNVTPKMVAFAITVVGGSSGAYTIQVQNTWSALSTGTPLGCYVSTGSLHLQDYANAVATQIALLGPGEIVSLPDLLPRSLRQPTADVSNPSRLTRRVLEPLDAFGEIDDVDFSHTFAAGTATPLSAPSVPTSTEDPPNILVLASLAFRAETT